MNNKDYKTYYGCPVPEEEKYDVQVIPSYQVAQPSQMQLSPELQAALVRVLESQERLNDTIADMSRRIEALENRPTELGFFGTIGNAIDNFIDFFAD